MQDIKGIAENLGLYIATMIIALIIYGLVILPAVYAILLRKNPFRLLSCVSKSLLTGVGTASRWVTMFWINKYSSINIIYFLSVKMKQSDWLRSLSERAGFLLSGLLSNACNCPLCRFSRQKLRSETIFNLKNLRNKFEKCSLKI
jgi:hypothetical protein